jgi:hypothetical protein
LQLITTVKEKVDKRRQNLRWERLSRTFQDPVRVTRLLHIRYLWVDSHCIKDGDDDDWLREAAKITASSDGSFGLFREPGEPVCYTELRRSGGPGGDDEDGSQLKRLFLRRCFPHDVFSTFVPDGLPLLTRTWVLHERLLSARLVHFAQDELVWECTSENHACECGEAQARGSNRGTVKTGDVVERTGVEWQTKDDDYYRQRHWDRERESLKMEIPVTMRTKVSRFWNASNTLHVWCNRPDYLLSQILIILVP